MRGHSQHHALMGPSSGLLINWSPYSIYTWYRWDFTAIDLFRLICRSFSIYRLSLIRWAFQSTQSHLWAPLGSSFSINSSSIIWHSFAYHWTGQPIFTIISWIWELLACLPWLFASVSTTTIATDYNAFLNKTYPDQRNIALKATISSVCWKYTKYFKVHSTTTVTLWKLLS